MELLNFLSQVPVPILILVIAVLVVVTAVVVYQYAKAKGLEGIRKEVYELFLRAEHRLNSSSKQYFIRNFRLLLYFSQPLYAAIRQALHQGTNPLAL